MSISSLKQIELQLERGVSPESKVVKTATQSAFGEALARAGAAVAEPHSHAASAVEQFENGSGSVHETLLALEKADISLKYMMNVRNKLLDAYREVMQMGA